MPRSDQDESERTAGRLYVQRPPYHFDHLLELPSRLRDRVAHENKVW
jgi:hypothetical protein